MQESTYARDLAKMGIAAAIMAAVFVVDQLSKLFAFASERMSDLSVIPWLFGFIHHENHGIVANIPIPLPLIVTATIAILLLIGYLMKKEMHSDSTLRWIAYSIIAAGAIGNLYDRITLGYVRDWILLFNRSVINVADLAICGGILMLFIKQDVGRSK